MAATAATTAGSSSGSAGWGINRLNAAAWDPHMVIPLLQWLRNRSVNVPSDEAAVQTVLSHTTWTSAYEQLLEKPAPEDMKRRALLAHQQLEQLNATVTSFTACLLSVSRDSPKSASPLDRRTVVEWNVYWQSHLAEALKTVEPESAEAKALVASHRPFDASVLEACLRVGRILLDFGEYDMTRKQLTTYVELVCEWCTDARENLAFKLGAHWGLIVAYLALWAQRRDSAAYSSVESAAQADGLIQMGKLPGLILAVDNLLHEMSSTKKVLAQRVCLIHWAFFAVFLYYLPRNQQILKAHDSNGKPAIVPHALEWGKLIDWVFGDRTIGLIIGTAPHLLRYICVLAILNRRKELLLRAAVDTLNRAGPTEDPVTALVAALYVKYDFVAAQNQLLACSGAFSSDFLLSGIVGDLEENSRLLIFETYCRIQRSISIDSLSARLHMTAETAERWIVDLIRHAGLEAKIDSEKGRVEMASSSTSVYQHILETTRAFRVTYV